MKTLSQVLNYLLPLFYLAVLFVYSQFFFGKKKSWESKTTPALISLLVVHLLEIAIRLTALRAMPLSTAFDALSFLAFSIVLVYLIIELSAKNKASGLFILGFAFIGQVISTFNFSWTLETNKLLTNPMFIVHASLTIMGYTALSLSAIFALMYLIQKYNMKSRHFGIIYDQLPALTYLEFMSIRSVAIGIVLLGVGILLGHLQAIKALGSFWVTDAKVIVTDIVWLLYFSGYILSRLFKWRGRWMAYLSMAGFGILVGGGIVVVLWVQSFHKFV